VVTDLYPRHPDPGLSVHVSTVGPWGGCSIKDVKYAREALIGRGPSCIFDMDVIDLVKLPPPRFAHVVAFLFHPFS
jgi:hypothetical protein